jgi:fumarate reductase subunit D
MSKFFKKEYFYLYFFLLLLGAVVFATIFNETKLSNYLISFLYSINSAILLLIMVLLSFGGAFALSVSIFVNNKKHDYFPYLVLSCFFLIFLPLQLLNGKPASEIYISNLSSDIKKVMIKKEKVVCDFNGILDVNCFLVEKLIDSNGAFAPYTYGEINKIREYLEREKNKSKKKEHDGNQRK